MERTKTMDSIEEEERFQPRVFIALEYIEAEQMFNFYIKKIQDPPLFVKGRQKMSRVRLIVVKDVSRITWIYRQRRVTNQEIMERSSPIFRTLSVKRKNPIIFNEFFSSSLESEYFHKTLLRIQLVDVDRKDREVIIGETDYWIDTNPINRFTEFCLPMTTSRPDLGEFEFAMMAQPTIGRIVISDMKATNLPIMNETIGLFVKGNLFVKRHMLEQEISELQSKFSEEVTTFGNKLIFDVSGKELPYSTIVLTIVEKTSECEQSLGEVIISHRNPSCDRLHWKKMLSVVREKHTEIHKLYPSI